MGVEFGVLGDVEVRVEGRLVDVGHARQRCVLVVLLVEANHPVSLDQLVERVWGDLAPCRARETLYNYLSRLRHVLGPIPGVDLVRRTGRYVLTVDPMAVDVHRFADLIARARAAEVEGRALELFEQARGLWRGEPCAGLETPWVTALRDALERDRFAIELDCTDLHLHRGQHGWLLGEIAARAAAHPLDERVVGQLMLALYRSGRQAEALETFHHLRARLGEELGIDPGPELRRRYEQILTTDPALTAPAAVPPTPPVSTPLVSAPLVSGPPPRQLPVRIPHFVGRARELGQLTAVLERAGGAGGTVGIAAIHGTPGVGKTALALHWAHHVADRFPDGQLYVDLRGFDPTATPVCPVEVLRGFLDAFGVAAARIPAGMQAQAGLYRGMLTDRRVLVVLDNARDADQVRPLLPASPSCLVVITSRNQMAGLIAQQGARPVTLDVLSHQEARVLLAQQLGPDWVEAEPHTVTQLIEHCARLPLALAITAARASSHPGFTLRGLADELANERTCLDALDTGEASTSVRAVFSWSYHHLSAPAARMFRLLGLHPGPHIALPAAARLADLPREQAREALGELTRTHLLTQYVPGRYTFHDLLRAYATHLATTHDFSDERHAALTRLFDHYLDTTAAAMHTLHPTEQRQPPEDFPSATADPPVGDPVAARAWLATERVNLTAVIVHTATHGWHIHTTRLANTVLLRYLEIVEHDRAGLAVYTHVRRAAHHTGDQATEALALTNLGSIHWEQGRYPQAVEHHQQALTISREIGFPLGEALALLNLGLVYQQQGHYQLAAEHHQRAVEICRKIGDRSGEAFALTHLGFVHWRQGRDEQAAEHHQQALTISREVGFRRGEALALTHLGLIHRRQGRDEQAVEHHQQAIAISREIRFPVGEALALTYLGDVYCRQGHAGQAAEHHQQALTISREIGFPLGEALALTHLGDVLCRQGRDDQAAEHHQQAIAISREIGFPLGEALALTHLGDVYRRQGHAELAAEHHQQALALCHAIGDRTREAHIRDSPARPTGRADSPTRHGPSTAPYSPWPPGWATTAN
jgi:DNA-binding SARP family transcriptional activator/tetratricopeptide (TPR) repeat protein